VVQIVQFGENIDMTNLVDRFLNPDVVARSIMFSTGVVIEIQYIFLFFLLVLGLPSKFRSEKIPRKDSEQFSLFRGKKCSFRGIPCVSE
jgi:hypothetical protein